MRRLWKICGIFCCLFCFFFTVPVYAAEENDIYDSLQNSIKESWDNGLEELETDDEIEITGPLPERILRSIANVFYKHLVSIKAWSLFLGILSFVVGVFIAATAKLNKKLRRFSISLFVITIPVLLIIFVFGITKLVSMFN